mmetsp:Transcript_54645/g.88555  ORF Transcript_54645/g.88555 Transcript_54645/m.88555 type:complete len:125 (-) Transcript_54645:513-887(-)
MIYQDKSSYQSLPACTSQSPWGLIWKQNDVMWGASPISVAISHKNPLGAYSTIEISQSHVAHMWMSHVTIDRAYCAIRVILVVSLTCKRVMSSDLCKLPFPFQIVHSPCGPQTPSSKELHVSSV